MNSDNLEKVPVSTPNPIIEGRIQRDKLKAELYFYRSLFEEHLPVGEDTTEINDYFNQLETIIDTIEVSKLQDVRREQFPDSVEGRDYKYFSDAGFAKQSSRFSLLPNTQGVDPPTNHLGGTISTQSACKSIQSLEYVPEPTRRSDTGHLETKSDHL